MADNKNIQIPQSHHHHHHQQQQKIPVFTVLKNGAVLKNIFVVNDPPSPLSQPMSTLQDKKEEVLLVGRHPHCNIVLTHPSISRFHLQIFSDSGAHKIFIFDLSSVHGTWVSERKIEPGVRVEMREGDTIRLGGSSRIYRLHWVSLDHAYDLENSFLSKLDASMDREKEVEEDKSIGEEVEVKDYQEEQQVEIECKVAQDLEDLLTPEEKARQEENLCFWESKTEEVDTSDLLECDIEPAVFSETSPMLSTLEESLYLSASKTEKKNSSDILEESVYLSANNTEKKNSSDIVVDSIGSVHFSECSPMLEHMMSSNHLEENRGVGIDLESPLRAPSDTAVKVHDQEKHSCLDISAEPSGEDKNSITNLERDDPESYAAAARSEEIDHCSKVLSQLSLPENLSKVRSQQSKEVKADNNSTWQKRLSAILTNRENAYEYYGNSSKDQNLWKDGQEGRGDLSVHQVTQPADSFVPFQEILCDQKLNIEKHNYPMSAEVNAKSPIPKCGTKSNIPSIWLRRGKPATDIQLKTGKSKGKTTSAVLDRKNQNSKEKFENIPRTLFNGLEGEEEETFTPDKENLTPKALKSAIKIRSAVLDCKNQNNKENFENIPTTLFNGLEGEEEETFTPDKENLTPKSLKSATKIRSAVLDGENQNSKENFEPLFNGLEGEEEETFTPDKENLAPKALKSGIKIGLQHPESFRDDSILKTSSIPGDCALYHSPDKENITPRVLGECKKMQHMSKNRSCLQEISIKKRPIVRSPLKYLHVSPGSQLKSTGYDACTRDNLSVNCANIVRSPLKYLHASPGSQLKSTGYDACTRDNLSVNCAKLNENQSGFSNNVFAGQANSNWIMVVDTSSFLKRESWKSLQLLQGLKGTQLIIPRIVIRELKCVRQSFSLFRRTTKVSSILDWIEQSMLNTKWWVHIQNTVEEGRSVAPTPPATPHHRLDDGSEDCPIITSNCATISSSVVIPSPTTEDHVLECALIFKKLKSNEKLVLLSNDVSLKIQAMAEGILCETVEEFRESLVNPLSDRFMWVDSSPRGQNWSFATDTPEEKYSRTPLKKSSRGHGARGLKLILLHNSHYGQITSFS